MTKDTASYGNETEQYTSFWYWLIPLLALLIISVRLMVYAATFDPFEGKKYAIQQGSNKYTNLTRTSHNDFITADGKTMTLYGSFIVIEE